MECSKSFIRYTDGSRSPKTGELVWKTKLFKYSTMKFLIKQVDEWKLKYMKFKLIPCGKCPVCMFNKSKSWGIRLLNEVETSRNAYFLTLTYDDVHIPSSGSINKDVVRTFIDSLEKSIKRYLSRNFIKDYPPFKSYFVGEYGCESGRPHYHAIVFNVPFNDFTSFFPTPDGSFIKKRSKDGSYMMYSETLSRLWDKGFIEIGEVNYKSCLYVAGYVNKKFGQYDLSKYENSVLIPPFSIMSRGLGFDYFLKNYKKIAETDELFYKKRGKVLSCPIPQAYLVKLKKIDRKAYDYVMSFRDKKSDIKIRDLMSLDKMSLSKYFKDKRYNNFKKISSFTRSL